MISDHWLYDMWSRTSVRGPGVARARSLIAEAELRTDLESSPVFGTTLNYLDVKAFDALVDGPVQLYHFNDSPELIGFDRCAKAGLVFYLRRWDGETTVWPSRATWVVLQERREAKLADKAARSLALMEGR